MTPTTAPNPPLIKFFEQVEELASVNHRFFVRHELSSVAHGNARGAALGAALDALARSFDVSLMSPLNIDSRGELSINVDQKRSVGPANSYNGSKVYGSAFSELLNAYNPRCGVVGPAKLLPESAWCLMGHFDVEKMVIFAAENFKVEIFGGEPFREGRQVITLRGEVDSDEDGQERVTPVGTMGVLEEQSMPYQWLVSFGDASVHITESQLCDPARYRVIAEGDAEIGGSEAGSRVPVER